jgi:hypothetical protein
MSTQSDILIADALEMAVKALKIAHRADGALRKGQISYGRRLTHQAYNLSSEASGIVSDLHWCMNGNPTPHADRAYAYTGAVDYVIYTRLMALSAGA